MKFIYISIISLFFIALSIPAHAQRDAKTSSARAAYSTPPGSDKFKVKKKKKKKKSQRSKQAKKQKAYADRARRNAWAF